LRNWKERAGRYERPPGWIRRIFASANGDTKKTAQNHQTDDDQNRDGQTAGRIAVAE
jgi:hypothetical protein